MPAEQRAAQSLPHASKPTGIWAPDLASVAEATMDQSALAFALTAWPHPQTWQKEVIYPGLPLRPGKMF